MAKYKLCPVTAKDMLHVMEIMVIKCFMKMLYSHRIICKTSCELSNDIISIKLGTPECSNEMMSWEEAKNYCKNKDSELLMEETTLYKRGPGGAGEWLGEGEWKEKDVQISKKDNW